jgi:leucyl aminopeptidase (aminopeptidase T)
MGKKMLDIAKLAIEKCADVKPGESVLILAETGVSNRMITSFMSAAVSAAGGDVSVVIYNSRPAYVDPPKPLPIAIKNVDVVICLDVYLAHTELDRKAREAGTRLLNVHPASFGALRRAFLGVDYDLIRRRGEKISKILLSGGKCNINSPIGTNLEVGISIDKGARIRHGTARERGMEETIPGGKVSFDPIEETVNGVIVVNGVVVPPVGVLKETVKLTFEKGRVVDIEGGVEADQYSRYLESFKDPYIYGIGHFTLGLNPKATLTDSSFHEVRGFTSSLAESIMGCVNLGIGRTAGDYGKATQHTDIVAVGTTVEIDGQVIIKDGKYTIF